MNDLSRPARLRSASVRPARMPVHAAQEQRLVRVVPAVEPFVQGRVLRPDAEGNARDHQHVAVHAAAAALGLGHECCKCIDVGNVVLGVGRQQPDAAEHGVHMAVDQARQERLPAEIGHVRVGRDARSRFATAADGDDLAVANRYRFCVRLLRVGREDVPVHQDLVLGHGSAQWHECEAHQAAQCRIEANDWSHDLSRSSWGARPA